MLVGANRRFRHAGRWHRIVWLAVFGQKSQVFHSRRRRLCGNAWGCHESSRLTLLQSSRQDRAASSRSTAGPRRHPGRVRLMWTWRSRRHDAQHSATRSRGSAGLGRVVCPEASERADHRSRKARCRHPDMCGDRGPHTRTPDAQAGAALFRVAERLPRRRTAPAPLIDAKRSSSSPPPVLYNRSFVPE